jgi:streptogrisin C
MGRIGVLLAGVLVIGGALMVPRPMAAGAATTVTARAAGHEVRGGDVFYVAGARCTAGFAVAGGYVTAGLCGGAGSATSGAGQVGQGTVASSSYPGPGAAWVRVNSDWTPVGAVRTGSGTTPVRGSSAAPVGSAACHYGSTSGWHCGTITARNATVQFPQGTLSGLIRTNICAEPGDQGAPLIVGGQAQGILVGGSGNCSSGGSSFYIPIATILQTYGLTLLTG